MGMHAEGLAVDVAQLESMDDETNQTIDGHAGDDHLIRLQQVALGFRSSTLMWERRGGTHGIAPPCRARNASLISWSRGAAAETLKMFRSLSWRRPFGRRRCRTMTL